MEEKEKKEMNFFKFFFTDDVTVKVNYASVFEECKTDSDRGKLIMGMITYVKTGVEPTLPDKLKKDWRYIKSGLKASIKGFENGIKNDNSKPKSNRNRTENHEVLDKNEMKMEQKSNSTPIENQQVNRILLTATPSTDNRIDKIDKIDRIDKIDNKKENELSTTTSTLCNTEDKSYVNRELGNKLYQAMVKKMSKTPSAWFTFTFKEAEAVGVDEITFKTLKQSLVDRGYLLQQLNASSINSGQMVWWYYLPKAKIEKTEIVYLQKKHTNSTRLDVVGLDINLHNLMIQIPPETENFRTDFINLNRDRINEVVEKNCLKEFKKLTDIYIYIWEKIQNGEYSYQPQTIKTNEDEQEQDFVNPHMDELKACVEIAVENGEDPTSDDFVDTLLERFDDLGVDEIKKTISSISTKVLSKVG